MCWSNACKAFAANRLAGTMPSLLARMMTPGAVVGSGPGRDAGETSMRLIELTARKGGGAVWVNPDKLDWVGPADAGGSSMYGEGNVRSGAKLHFAHGADLDVQEAPEEVVMRLAG